MLSNMRHEQKSIKWYENKNQPQVLSIDNGTDGLIMIVDKRDSDVTN